MNAEQEIRKERLFRRELLNWYAGSHRPLPWKEARDPYVIWLSEVILQQTRVQQGLPYFKRFLERFPRVEDLAAASQEEVLKLWEGLGYYSRARNMHHTAQYISRERGGRFPETYKELLSLKGVGPYTAAAIASFAFDLPHAVVDGNVFRVLARFFGIDLPIDGSEGKKYFSALAGRLLDPGNPGRYNQAIMDFGATHCTPRNPLCSTCLLQEDCYAFGEQRVSELPVKAKKLVKKERFFHYLVLQYGQSVFLRKRVEKDIWQHLFEFPLIETPRPLTRTEELAGQPRWRQYVGDIPYEVSQVSPPFQQTLTHQKITARFWKLQLQEPPPLEKHSLLEANRKNLRKFAFPKIIDCYLQDKSLYLNLS